jgi:pimeloyl-ACP methyl ester carboxylesterase
MIRDSLPLPSRGVELGLIDFGGDGPLAVLSHANGFCASLYEPVATRLRDRYRVIAFDSRGHGDSSVPASPEAYEWEEFIADWQAVAEALCDRVGVKQVALGVGHSFGGSCLLSAAVRDPDRFAAVALIDPVLIPPRGERSGPFMGEGDHPMALAARRRSAVFPSRDAIRKSWALRGVFADWDPAILDLYLRDGFRDLADGSVELKCPPQVEAAVYQAGPHTDLFAEIPSLRTPALWLHAGRGNFALELIERAAASSPYIELASLDAGHLMLMTDPDDIARRLLAWMSLATGDVRGSSATS